MKRKFNKGDIVYKIESTNDGGAIIKRFQVIGIGFKDGFEDFLVDGVPKTRETQIPIIECENSKNMFESEYNYYSFNEIPNVISGFLNKKKLW